MLAVVEEMLLFIKKDKKDKGESFKSCIEGENFKRKNLQAKGV